jgi:tetratricopeptide (TPR) repeat protein
VPAREAASVADIRGFRLYRRRYYGQALEWFAAAVAADPSFELALYNAARAAALGGRPELARGYLSRLRALATPLARTLASRAAADPDLASPSRD